MKIAFNPVTARKSDSTWLLPVLFVLEEEVMRKYKMALAAVVVLGVTAGLFVGQVLSQEAQPGRRGQAAGGQGRRDPEQMRQMYLQLMKEDLAATDEEWKVLGPKIENIQTISRQFMSASRMRTAPGGAVGAGGRAMATGTARTPTPTPAGPGTQRELTDVEKAVQKLQTTVDNKDAKPDDIKSALKALREAREKAKEQLAKAQGEVRELVTPRQEAKLVLWGVLD